jgi:hypothetical protein
MRGSVRGRPGNWPSYRDEAPLHIRFGSVPDREQRSIRGARPTRQSPTTATHQGEQLPAARMTLHGCEGVLRSNCLV